MLDYICFSLARAANLFTNYFYNLDRWTKQWVVYFNPKKTVIVNFTRKNISQPSIQFGYNGPVI